MFARLRRRRADVRGVRFCESCSEVCTPACRVRARFDRTRAETIYAAGLPR
jgi:hypothetical protein